MKTSGNRIRRGTRRDFDITRWCACAWRCGGISGTALKYQQHRTGASWRGTLVTGRTRQLFVRRKTIYLGAHSAARCAFSRAAALFCAARHLTLTAPLLSRPIFLRAYRARPPRTAICSKRNPSLSLHPTFLSNIRISPLCSNQLYSISDPSHLNHSHLKRTEEGLGRRNSPASWFPHYRT